LVRGAVLKGILLPDGGLLDIYLEDKRHTLRLKVRGEPYRESTGAKISISSLIVYRQQGAAG